MLLTVVVSFVLGFILIFLQSTDYKETWEYLKKSPSLYFLNSFPIMAFALILEFFIGGVFASLIAVNLFVIGAIVNRLKTLYRNDPLLPSDILLGPEGVGIFIKGKYKIDYKLVFLYILINLSLFIIFQQVNETEVEKSFLQVFLLFLVTIFTFFKIYGSDRIYNSFPSPSKTEKDQYMAKGFVYSFIYNIKFILPDKIDRVKLEKVLEESKAYRPEKLPNMPNIIMIMGEGFSDISDRIRDKKVDPLENFKNISREGISGNILVSSYGGGTADTEFDTLTGLSTPFVTEKGVYPHRFVKGKTLSIVRQLKDFGYYTKAMHPGASWFYKRNKVFKHLGFDEFSFEETFSKDDYLGQYVSEKATYDKILKDINYLEGKGSPFFYFTITIQNHGPHEYGKYPDKNMEFVGENYSKKAKEYLDTYLRGIYDMDRELGRLKESLERSDKPYIILYYGDHLPFLGKNDLAYKEIGMGIDRTKREGYFNYYKVPYLLWANAGGKDYLRKIEISENLYSANYLGSLLLDPVVDKAHPMYQFIRKMREELPILSRVWIKERGGLKAFKDISPRGKTMLEKYKAYIGANLFRKMST